MSNFTDGDKTFDELICSTTPNKKPAVVFLSAFNFLLSLIASAGNSLILIALQKPSSLHPPSKVLLCSLAASDLCVGLILQPLVAILLTAVAVESKSLCRPMLGLSFPIVTAVATQNGLTPALVLGWRFTSSIVFLNSSLNPFLYCWKIAEVKQAVKDTIRKSFSLG
ncbi:hypothetical protein pdam_00019504 [Pocillopora damicornis]|uniref:G-protein coupled receptors family 1 profile domain-containing protein n=1 Tax=Pocillopora damicornis TaxID=46731 RepID=A0A3M6TQZ8_POCDA|nr:hypothetical protein pdam_00019504 [Pocillopora damicornis]